jgi:RNA polymerase sigma-70 factor (ECF subfamily)
MADRWPTVGAEARFNAVVDEYGKFLSNAIANLCPKDLGLQFSDIEQDARVRLWRALEGEREIRDLASYIYRIAATATIDAVRRVKARREEQLRLAEEDDEGGGRVAQLTSDPEQSPDLQAERGQLVQKIRSALARLQENRRRAVGLHLEGMTSQEIADLLAWSEPKARNLVYRGLKDLRKELGAEGIAYEAE